MKYFSLILLVFAVMPVAAGDAYKIDRINAIHLADDPPTLSPPARVQIYFTGLGVGFDKTTAEFLLRRGNPQCVITSSSEIGKLLSILRENNVEQSLNNINKTQGYSTHLLLFDETQKSVLHLRIFEPVNDTNNLCAVYPECTTKFVQYNERMGRWLRGHVKYPVATEPYKPTKAPTVP